MKIVKITLINGKQMAGFLSSLNHQEVDLTIDGLLHRGVNLSQVDEIYSFDDDDLIYSRQNMVVNEIKTGYNI